MRNETAGEKKAEKQILDDALREFEALTGVAAAVEKTGVTLPGGADARVRLGGDRLLVEVKRHVNPATLGPILVQLGQLPEPGLLVTDHVTPPMAERLRQQEVHFIDAAGNAYLRTRVGFFFVTGRKPTVRAPRDRATRAFRATGLRVIFALLCLPDLAAAPYREIAEKAGVALGSINIVLKELEQLGYLQVTKTRGRFLVQRERLINLWAEAYARELRPRLNVRRFRVEESDWWKDVDLAEFHAWLGGEAAAALLTRYLRPEKVTVFGATRFKELAARLRPVKDEQGNLELLEPFWHFEVAQPVAGYQLVPPLLVYADLLATGDERNLETAAMIKERYLG